MSDDSAPSPLGGEASKRRPRVVYDPTINLGNMIGIATMLAAVAGVYADSRSEIRSHDVRINAIEKAMEVQGERLLDDMRTLRDDGRETRTEVRRLSDDLRRAPAK